jgi:hypothetical protein
MGGVAHPCEGGSGGFTGSSPERHRLVTHRLGGHRTVTFDRWADRLGRVRDGLGDRAQDVQTEE